MDPERRRLLLLAGAAVGAAAVLAAAYFMLSSSHDGDQAPQKGKAGKAAGASSTGEAAAAAQAGRAGAEKEREAAARGGAASASATEAPPAASGSGAASAGAVGVAGREDASAVGARISAETTKTVLRFLHDRLEEISEALKRDIAELEAQGQTPSEEFLARTPAQLKEVEQEMVTRYGLSTTDLSLAQVAHANDPEVAELAAAVQRLLVGEQGAEALAHAASEVPPGMTADKFYEMFLRQVEIVDEAFQQAVERVRADAASQPVARRRRYLEKVVMDMVPEVSARVQAAIGLSDQQFQYCMLHFLQRDVRFVEALHASQERQDALRRTLFES